LDPERLKVFREILQNRLESLDQTTGNAIGELTQKRDTHADANDLASEESDREFALRLHEHELLLIKQIRQALKRIDDDDFGDCVACGEEIGERRLMARPMSTHCIDCQTELEQMGRRRAW